MLKVRTVSIKAQPRCVRCGLTGTTRFCYYLDREPVSGWVCSQCRPWLKAWAEREGLKLAVEEL